MQLGVARYDRRNRVFTKSGREQVFSQTTRFLNLEFFRTIELFWAVYTKSGLNILVMKEAIEIALFDLKLECASASQFEFQVKLYRQNPPFKGLRNKGSNTKFIKSCYRWSSKPPRTRGGVGGVDM
jgi:hypothetical protein